MWVQIKGGNKIRMGLINVITLPCLCVHQASNSFSVCEQMCNLYMIEINRPELAVPYDQAII